MRGKRMMSLLMGTMVMLGGCSSIKDVSTFTPLEKPSFKETSVHDPSVIKVEDTYYVFGSHLQAAKTQDLMTWTQISTGPEKGNKLIPNPKEEMAEALEWAETNTFWAGDVIQLADGKFYMYYCNCKGDSPRSYLGLAVADNVEGPYTQVGPILKSGMWGEPGIDGKLYDPTVAPNAIDPDVFFDKEGKLWMVYGSYSGGIFIMELNPDTGFPLEGQGYGKKLLGGNHSRIEGPYILYNKETDYYYLFLSFGGLDANGGYNIRVARSKTPDGPYYDAEGNDMIKCKGASGSFFDDKTISPYGVKLMGSYQFIFSEGEPKKIRTGYQSPGHNSAYYDEEKDQYYLIFHTRFTLRGESYEVRTHQMFFNEEGWPVVAPYRYSGEVQGKYAKADIVGSYKYINHGKDITKEIKRSQDIRLEANGKITGAVTGNWIKKGDAQIQLEIDEEVYDGQLLHQWDTDLERETLVFTVISNKGVALWGSKIMEK